MVLISLVGTTALLSVGVGGFKDVLGVASDGNDAGKIQNKFYVPVRNVCVQGTNADDRVRTFTLSNKINVTLISEERDPVKDQSVRATLVEESVQLLQTDKITDCVIKFKNGPETYQVFKKEQPYEVTVKNMGEAGGGKPATRIIVEER
ncbi:hypothetical protein GKQ38_05220 [Candidatus Nanohaloarchaea archaeon]|nr:hypothetical protein GKQ38_05220 [Candidatus Nanohaloarchaea archaeon]